MKKAVSFLTVLLMLSSLSVPFVYAEDEAKSEETTSAAEEASVTEKDTSEKEEKDFTVWHLNATAPAEGVLTDDKENREYIFEVVNPGGEKRGGTDKWDLQFRIRGFSIVKDHDYTIKYRIAADSAGRYYTKIANYTSTDVGEAVAGEVWHNQYGISTIRSYVDGIVKRDSETNYSSAWNNQDIGQGDTLSVTCDFKGLADIEEAEWCFFLGGAGATTTYDCFVPGAIIRFSNLVLIDNTTGETLVSAYPDTQIKVKGDINGDDIVDTTDLTLMSLGLIGDTKLDDSQLDHADLNGDGNFHISDAALLQQYLSKKIDEL